MAVREGTFDGPSSVPIDQRTRQSYTAYFVTQSGTPDARQRVPEVVRKHMPALDGLRGLAIALVLLHNLCGIDASGNHVLRVIDSALTIGWVGVQLFFVLSGFLITGILLDDRGKQGYFRAFFARRVLRIFPLYYLALVSYFLVLPALVHLPVALSNSVQHNQVWYWLYLSNWASPINHGVPGLPHFWSLAVEEQFYLAWPLVVFFADGRKLAKLCVALVVFALAVRLGIRMRGLPPEIAYENTFARIDALALGGLGAVVVRDAAWVDWLLPRLRRIWIGVVVLALALPIGSHGLARTSFFVQTIGYTVIAMVFGLMVLSAAIAPAFEAGYKLTLSRWLSVAPLRWLGKYSYGIYVFHVPVRSLAYWFIGGERALTGGSTIHQLVRVFSFAALVTVATSIVAVLSFNVFEKRFLAMKDAFAPKKPVAEV